MEVFVLIIRLLLSGVFAVAAVGKLADLKGAEKAARGFGVPGSLARPLAYGIPIAEIAVALMLLFPEVSFFGAGAASFLLISFVAGMAYQMAKGNAPDCHCFGQLHSEPVGAATIVRNVLLLLAAAFLVVRGIDGQGVALANDLRETIMILGLVIAIMAGLAAILVAFAARADLQKLVRRIEMLEILSGENVSVDHDEAADPNNGLPIGAPLPEFELAKIGGGSIDSRSLADSGRPSLLFFVGPDCKPCASLYPEMEKWSEEFGDDIDLWVVSRGDAESNLAKFNGSLTDRLLLQSEREAAELLRARWTPTAILVGPTGRIASNPAVGDNLIRELMDKIRIRIDKATDEFIDVRVGSASGRKSFIGNLIPEFSVEDIHGHTVTDADLKGKEALAIFLAKNCRHCKQMAEEIVRREEGEHPNARDLFVFSDSDVETLRNYGLSSRVIYDPGFELAKSFGMYGSPSAVLINEEGRIVSESAIGQPNIWALRAETGGIDG